MFATSPVNMIDPTGHASVIAQEEDWVYYGIVPETDADDLCESIITEFVGDKDNQAQLVVYIDTGGYDSLVEKTGGWLEAAYYLGEYIMRNYGDKFIDNRTSLGVTTEAYIHYFLLMTNSHREGESEFTDKLIVQARELNVVFFNDDSNIIAERIAGYIRMFPDDEAEAILMVASYGYILSKLRDPEAFIQND